MCPQNAHAHGVSRGTISRRTLLAAGGTIAVSGLSGCLSRVASAVTDMEASPAAVFSGTQGESAGEFVVGEPHVSRLTPTLVERAELEGWVTSSPVMAQNHNSSRSNAPGESYVRDADTDDDGLSDGTEGADEELEPIYEYLGGEAMVAERFTVCLPDAEVPGGNGSIREAVTPERLLSYLTGESDGDGRVYSWGSPKAGPGETGDCDDDDPTGRPGAACGTSPHFVAEVTGPVSTGGSLEVIRANDGTLLVINSPSEADGGPGAVRINAGGGSDGPESSTEAIYQTWSGSSNGGGKATPEIFEKLVAQVTVQPPGCPHPFPALFHVGRAKNDGQLLYSGGWVIDDAALYKDSFTVLSMVEAAPVVSIDSSDLTATFEDVAGGRDVGRRIVMRRRRGARLDMGPIDGLVERGVLSEAGKEGNDSVIRKKPGGRRLVEEDGYALTHLALDAPVLHLVVADGVSNEVKFKTGAELSGQVN